MNAPFARRLLAAATALLVLATANGCGKRETAVDAATRQGVLLLGNNSDPATLDPQLVSTLSDFRISEALFEGLTIADPRTLEPKPGVAQSWEYDEKTVTWTFHLRADAKWSNGDPVTAGDFVFSFRRMLSPVLGVDYANMLYVIKNAEPYNKGTLKDFSQVGVKALDARTLQIQLEHPVGYFLTLCYHQTYLPVHPPTITKFDAFNRRDASWAKVGTLVGNGPFVLAKYILGNVVEVKKNPLYWNAANVKLNGIRFFPTTDLNAEERMFRNGLLHATYALPPLKTAAYLESHSPFLRLIPVYGHYFYILNVTKPPLDDVRVRKALNLAIDRRALVDHVVRGGQTPMYSITPPSAQYQARAQIKEDVAEAKRLLAEAGHPNGDGLPPIELLYNTSEAHRAVAEALQQMWRENLGLTVQLANVSAPAWLDRRRAGDFQIYRAGWYGDYLDPSTFLDLFKSGNALFHSGWSNPKYDALMNEATYELDPARRMEDFQQAEALLVDGAPFIPLYEYTTILLARPELQGYYANPLDMHPYNDMSLEPVAKK